jgi:hypothetical protein
VGVGVVVVGLADVLELRAPLRSVGVDLVDVDLVDVDLVDVDLVDVDLVDVDLVDVDLVDAGVVDGGVVDGAGGEVSGVAVGVRQAGSSWLRRRLFTVFSASFLLLAGMPLFTWEPPKGVRCEIGRSVTSSTSKNFKGPNSVFTPR